MNNKHWKRDLVLVIFTVCSVIPFYSSALKARINLLCHFCNLSPSPSIIQIIHISSQIIKSINVRNGRQILWPSNLQASIFFFLINSHYYDRSLLIFVLFIIYQTLKIWTTGFLTFTHDLLMHMYTHSSRTLTATEQVSTSFWLGTK